MSKLVLCVPGVFILIGASLLVTGTVVGADNPHAGSFAATTDACGACHRAHTAAGDTLLKTTSQNALCLSCHDGAGADTNVDSGVYLGTHAGTQNAGLRGGGFTQALMNTALSDTFDETGTPMAVTSSHTTGSSSATAWGSGTIGTGSGETVTLECANCHNPHGNASYRILRPKPTALSAWDSLTPVIVPDEATTTYTVAYGANYYRDTEAYESDVITGLTNWCSQCHARYLAQFGAASFPSGDDIFAYRHTTAGVFPGGCPKCHVAHGSSATMGDYANAVPWPDQTPGSTGTNSRLLHVDNRGNCTLCHLDGEGNIVWYNHAGTPSVPDDDYCASCHRARVE